MSALNRYIGAAVLAAAVITTACSGSEAQEAVEAEAAAAPGAGPERVVNVELITVTARPFSEQVALTGVLEATRDITVAAEETGVIREVFVNKGARVQAGQPIARIDDRVLRAQYDQARSEADLAQETYERQRRLWEDEKIGTEINFLRAKYGAQTADANARVLGARLERTVVRAPIGGVLDDRMIEVGSMVAPGTPVGRIVDANPVKVTAGVPERYAADIKPGAPVRALIEHVGAGAFEGRTSFVATALDVRTRTFPVEFSIANPGGVLKPGMVAQLELQRGGLAEALLIPREAVQRASTGYIVYVVTGTGEDLRAETRPVQLGAGAGSEVEIVGGLQAGDRVIVVGQQQVANGDAVRVVGEATNE
jgi:RND family efflux transporter MFP subunit